MDIRLIAFDLDGTLLRSDKSISPRTMQALLAARERGVLLVPSTGRLLRSLPEPLLDKSLTRYHILVNGAQVYDSFEDKTLLREELTPQQAMCRFAAVPTPNSPEPFTLQRIPAHSAIFATVRAGYRPPALVT